MLISQDIVLLLIVVCLALLIPALVFISYTFLWGTLQHRPGQSPSSEDIYYYNPSASRYDPTSDSDSGPLASQPGAHSSQLSIQHQRPQGGRRWFGRGDDRRKRQLPTNRRDYTDIDDSLDENS